MTPESTSSSEGSFIERSRAFERRVERNRLVMERQSELIPDLAATINTDFASIATQSTGSGGNSSSQGFDFQGWFQGVYEEQRHAVREAPLQVREQRVHSAGDGAFLSPPEDHRVRSWSQGRNNGLLWSLCHHPTTPSPQPPACFTSLFFGSAHRGVHYRLEDLTQTQQQQRLDWPTVTVTWHASE